MRLPRAFTIVELLVVITIIVVLLALLVPALDTAIYQAELAVCGANQHGIVSGAETYALGHRRAYPDRFVDADGGYMAGELYHMGPAFDDRPMLTPFIPLRMFLDPLCGKVDLSLEANHSDAIVSSNYDLYFGLRFYDGGVAQQGIKRLGDRLVWKDDSFNVMVMDHERIYDGSWAMSSHPDKDGKLGLEIWQNRFAADSGVAGVGVFKYTISRWDNNNSNRGPVDINLGLSDGSVRRFNDFARDQWLTDPRVSRVPSYVNGQNQLKEYSQMPLD